MKLLQILIIILIPYSASAGSGLSFLPGQDKYMLKELKRAEYRELKHFKVGKKYCLYGSKNWDEACQDEAMKYAFRYDSWQNKKKFILEFIELANKNDLDGLANLCHLPIEIRRDYVNESGEDLWEFRSIRTSDELKKLITELLNYKNGILRKITYANLILKPPTTGGMDGYNFDFDNIRFNTENNKIIDIRIFKY